MGLLTDFKKKMQQTELHSRLLVHVEVAVSSLLLKQNTAQGMRVRETAPTRPKRERPYHKTNPIVFASRLFQVGDNHPGQTPMMLAKMSTRCGILKSLVRMAFFRAGREDIQSRVSAPFNRFTMNSVIATTSKLPNTLEDVRCKHRLKSRRSKTG